LPIARAFIALTPSNARRGVHHEARFARAFQCQASERAAAHVSSGRGAFALVKRRKNSGFRCVQPAR
jgi:hypothetical protein